MNKTIGWFSIHIYIYIYIYIAENLPAPVIVIKKYTGCVAWFVVSIHIYPRRLVTRAVPSPWSLPTGRQGSYGRTAGPLPIPRIFTAFSPSCPFLAVSLSPLSRNFTIMSRKTSTIIISGTTIGIISAIPDAVSFGQN